MPPRVRNKVTKTLKENIGTENRLKSTRSTSNRPRKVLGDKTNSASDDNTSEIREIKKPVANRSNVTKTELKKNERPRRDRRLPTRFVENPVLNNLSNSRDTSDGKLINVKATSATNNASITSNNAISPFKTPGKAETSLVVQRPKRICKLPSRLSDALSPNKYLPIQPTNASTPIQNKPKVLLTNKTTEKTQKVVKPVATETKLTKANVKKSSKATLSSNIRSDTNNNARTRSQRVKKQVSAEKVGPKLVKKKAETPALEKPKVKHVEVLKSTSKKASPKNDIVSKTKNTNTSSSSNKTISFNVSNSYLISISPSPKKASPKKAGLKKPSLNIKAKNLSFKVLGGNKKSQQQENSGIDVYEFTFDPNEEPPPQKKKRKRNATKKPSKPKKVVLKSSYDTNIAKALNALKNVVKTTQSTNLPKVQETGSTKPQDKQRLTTTTVNHVNTSENLKENTNTPYNNAANCKSIRIEDIAADIEPSIEDHHDDLNYSPVYSPVPEPTPEETQTVEKPIRKPHDPLNLLDEFSFFDEVPVASSSINTSVRHPLASPWRVEFGSLPIKWHVNTYVKANMTPAVESSFISAEDSGRKRHVYTNLVPQETEPLPEIVDTPNYKQTSIISFIRERAEKSARKKRGRSMSPTKANSLFEDITNIDNKKQQTSIEQAIGNNSESTNNTSNEKEHSCEKRKTRKRKNDENVCELPSKSPRKQKDKDCTFFGFDDSENVDTENVSPDQENPKGRVLRHKSRAVLQEINGPSRAVLPVAAKSKVTTSSEAVNKVYEELKAATDAPVFVENNVNNVTNVEDMAMNDDSQSVHLFEDIDIVHHLKPTRKSYGKPKKVTFQQHSSDSDTQEGLPVLNDSSDEDDGADLTFEVPNVQEKKKTKKKRPKKLMSKKEEKEAAEWAAGFNSMCEDIEEFPLLIE